ncbi:MAG TPA: tetratricopeptide repeat protein [Acidobacteriaceae bacterium]
MQRVHWAWMAAARFFLALDLYAWRVRGGLACVALLLVAGGRVGAQMAPCSPPAELAGKPLGTAESYADLGNWYGHHQRYDCAVEVLREGLRGNAGSAPLLYLLGLNLYAGGQAEQARAPIEEVAQRLPTELAPHLLLATILEKLGQRTQAEAEWRAGYAIDPHSPAALDGLSRSLMEGGDPAAAIDLLTAVPHEQLVRNEDLALDLARAYGNARMLEQAAAVLTEALALAPGSVRLAGGLETILVLETHYQAAADLAESVARGRPGDLDAQRQYLQLLVLNHNLETARPLAAKLLAAAPHDFDFLYLSGILERDAGEYGAARDHLREAVQLRPGDASARYNLGAALLALKDLAGAREQLAKALELGAQAPEVRFAYANTLRTLGETEPARQQLLLYQQALKEQEARLLAASKSAQGAQEMGKVEAGTGGDAARAASLYREALAAAPHDAQLAYQLSLALEKAGDKKGEEAALAQAVANDPTFALAQHQLGAMLLERAAAGEAETHFRAAVKAAPAYASAWIGLAVALGAEGRLTEARQALGTGQRLDPRNPSAQQVEQALEQAAGVAPR